MHQKPLLPKGISFHPSPNNKFLDWSKFKAVAYYKINVTEKLKLILGRVENIEGKGGNAGNQHFLLFLQCFQKASYTGLLKVVIVWLRIKFVNYVIRSTTELFL